MQIHSCEARSTFPNTEKKDSTDSLISRLEKRGKAAFASTLGQLLATPTLATSVAMRSGSVLTTGTLTVFNTTAD